MLARALWIAAVALGALVLVVSVNSHRFARRVAREAREMWESPTAPRAVDRVRPGELPPPVGRFLARAVGTRAVAVRTVRLRHGGTFRPKLDGRWLTIRGDEYFTADPPGFVWWGRARIAPGVWVEARDRSVGGVGNMLVSAESSFTLADGKGPAMDQGALLRLLAEMPWFPTALFDDRYVTWTAVDDRRAGARLRVNGREVAGVFEFGDDHLITTFTADRERDLGGGGSVLTPWSGQYGDYRDVEGLLVPHHVVVSWKVGDQPIPYARFAVERLEFDAAEPF
jgi:hypothetical protein